MNNHWQCSTPHQHQTNGQRHPMHILCMTLNNQPDLCNKKSQEIIDNTIITYFTGNPLQQAIMTRIPDCFTPIVCNCTKYPQPTLNPHSYHRKILTMNTAKPLTTKDHHKHSTSGNTTGLPSSLSIPQL